MVYGHYYKTIQKGFIIDDACPNCESKGGMNAKIVCKVNHMMFIPIYPQDKRAVCECNICKKMYYPNAFPAYTEKVADLLKKSRYPWYYFIGMALFVGLMAMVAIMIATSSGRSNEKLQSDLDNLHAGNVIFYNLEDGHKTSMMVDTIKEDTIYVRENKLTTNKNVYHLDESHNYSLRQTYYLKPQLDKMIEDNIIFEIH